MHAQGIVPKLHMSIFKVFFYQKLPTHIWSILLTYKTFCCFIHIYAHWRANLMSCTHLHLFEKEFSCHLSTLERQFHIIYSFWEAFSCHIQHVYIYKALDHLFNIYTFYLKGIFCYIFTHFARNFHAIYIQHFARHFMLYIQHFARHFMLYIQHFAGHFFHAIYSHIYILFERYFQATKVQGIPREAANLNPSQKTSQTCSNASFTFETKNLDS